MKILTFIDHYLPGYKAGGPIRSLSNAIAQLPDALQFRIVTRNRDLCESRPYGGVRFDAWNEVGRAQVLYLTRMAENPVYLGRLARQEAPDVVYLNSLFSRLGIRYLLARRLGLAPRTPLVLAPCGELAPGALAIRPYKKKPYLRLAASLGVFDGALWRASTERERAEIRTSLEALGLEKKGWPIAVAPDLVSLPLSPVERKAPKRPGCARFIFVSRVSPMKNLHQVIALTGKLRGEVSLDIFGPIDEEAYWKRCLEAQARLPPHVRCTYRGPVPPSQVLALFGAHDFFVLPTRGENFGHVIFESLSAGCPVVLSDTTSWSGLAERNCGWTLPLGDESAWVQTLQRCVDMDDEAHQYMVASAMAAAEQYVKQQRGIEQNIRVFEWAARGAAPERRPVGLG